MTGDRLALSPTRMDKLVLKALASTIRRLLDYCPAHLNAAYVAKLLGGGVFSLRPNSQDVFTPLLVGPPY